MSILIATASCLFSNVKGFAAALMCDDGCSHDDCVLPLEKQAVCILLFEF